jgi:uncharacterized protein (TIGR03435 family)
MKTAPCLLLIFACVTAWAQTPSNGPSFEVASIRAIEPGLRHQVTIDDQPGMLTMRSVTLRNCVEWAYEVQSFQISGPSWLGDTRFDIQAKAADTANIGRLRLMLRALLAERFGMKLHHEQKNLAVYFLVVAPNGPKFHDMGPKDHSKFLNTIGDGPNHFGEEKTGLVAEHVRMSEIAAELSQPLQRPVIDKTELTGRYDLRIDTTAFLASTADGDGRVPMDEMSVIFAAFPAQLGLKLEPGKDTVDFIVIDSADKTSTEN